MEKGKIKSIGKSLDLLELLSDNKKEMGITEISKELHMGISTVHRILTTLKYRGYIIQNQQTLKYALGIKWFILGCKVQSTMNLVNLVTPFLQKLSKKTNEGINFAILEGREAVCLSKIVFLALTKYKGANYTHLSELLEEDEGELPHQKSTPNGIDASYKNLNEIILIIT